MVLSLLKVLLQPHCFLLEKTAPPEQLFLIVLLTHNTPLTEDMTIRLLMFLSAGHTPAANTLQSPDLPNAIADNIVFYFIP